MAKSKLLALVLSAGVLAPSITEAATFARPAGQAASTSAVEQVDWRDRDRNWRGRGYDGRRYDHGRAYYGRPYAYGRSYYGNPYWYDRPWARRPYYGNVVAGVAIGTLIGVAVVGSVPRRPAPDLCWYWADPYHERGYWDYC